MKFTQLIIILLFPSFMFAQDFGYFGKKNVIAVNGLANMPLIYLFANKGTTTYKADSNGKLSESKNLLDYGMNVSFSHAFSGKFALGFEYALNFAKCNGPSYGSLYDPGDEFNSSYYNYINFKHEQLALRTMTFMPKIEYSMLGAQLPFGINNQFGIGYTTTKVLDKDYAVALQTDYSNDPTMLSSWDPKKTLNPNRKSISGITVMYGFNVRTPISKSLFINYGIRYTLNATFNFQKLFGNGIDHASYYVNDADVSELVSRKRLTSVLALNFGINYVF